MSDLGSDLLVRLKDGFKYDLTLVCEGGEHVEVHQFILTARSFVFKTMMEVDMVEKMTRTVEIKEFNQEVVTEFVNYLYSDKISDGFANLTELFKIGHKYQVGGLVGKCTELLVSSVTVDNFALLGTLAENFDVLKLSKKCAEFLTKNFDSLDIEKLDSLPSSLLRKSFSTYIEKSPIQYEVNFSLHWSPKNKTVKEANSTIDTSFFVDRETKLAAIGVFISNMAGAGGGSTPIELSLSHGEGETNVVKSSVKVGVYSRDNASSKPLKIHFPLPIKVFKDVRYKLLMKFKKKCQIRSGFMRENASVVMKRGKLSVDFSGFMSDSIPVLYFQD